MAKGTSFFRKAEVKGLVDLDFNVAFQALDVSFRENTNEDFRAETTRRAASWKTEELDLYARTAEDRMRTMPPYFIAEVYQERVQAFASEVDRRHAQELGYTLVARLGDGT